MSSRRQGLRGFVVILVLLCLAATVTLAPTLISSGTKPSDPGHSLVSRGDEIPARFQLHPGPQIPLDKARTTAPPAPTSPGPAPSNAPFGPNVPVWRDPREQSEPSIAVDSTGRVYVAFSHLAAVSNSDVYVSWSDDEGATWRTPVPAAAGASNERSPSLIIGPGDDVTVFYAQDADVTRVAYVRSSDRGATWATTTIALTPEVTRFGHPSFVANGPGAVGMYEAWCTEPKVCGTGAWTLDMLFLPDLSNASKWLGVYFAQTPDVELFHPSTGFDAVSGDLVGAMEIEINDGADYDLTWFRYNPTTAFFSQDALMCYRICGSTQRVWPSIAVEGERAVVGAVFSNATFFGPDPVILANYSTNVSSGTWQGVNGGSQRLGAPASDTGALALTLDGSLVVAAYSAEGATWNVTSLDGGATFGPPVRVSDNLPGTAVGGPRGVAVAASSTRVFLAWEDRRDGDVNIYSTSSRRIHSVVLSTAPAGFLVRLDGGPAVTAPVSWNLLTGSDHVIEAVSPMPAGPGLRFVFKQWSDGNTSNPRTVLVTGDATYVAEFTVVYWLELGSNPPRMGIGDGIMSASGPRGWTPSASVPPVRVTRP